MPRTNRDHPHRRTIAAALIFAPFVCGSCLAQTTPRIARGSDLPLRLRDTIERALKNNLDIRVDQYAIDVSRIRIKGARGFYDPLLGGTLSTNSSSTPVTSLLQGGDITSQTIKTRNFGPTYTQNMPGGGSINASFLTARTVTNNSFDFVNPLVGSGLTLGIRQPILRGFRHDSTTHQLRILNLNARISEVQFRQAVSEIVQRVDQQYWTLEYAQEAWHAQQESYDLAVRQRDQIEQKVQAGLLTPVALTSARAEVALRQQDVIQAEVQVVAGQNALKLLLAGDPSDDLWTRNLVTTDRPTLTEPPATLDQALRAALDNRPELEQLGLQLKQNDVDRDFLLWETKPAVNLVGSAGSVGRAGTAYSSTYDPVTGTAIGRELDPNHPGFGGYQKAWGQALAFSYPNWSVGVELQVPIFNRSAKAQLAEAGVARRRIETTVKQQQQAIMAEVANAYQAVELQRRTVEVARLGRELSEEQLAGETARFAAGFTTNFEVLRYQRDLGDARVRELRAMVDYQIALSALRKAMDVIVDANDLVLAKSAR